MNNRFCGWYYKHQKGDQILALIPGVSKDNAFIQIITQDQSFCVNYDTSALSIGDTVSLHTSRFSMRGIELDIHAQDIDLTGTLTYREITPIAYDIMGVFRYFPMECRHGILSMRHTISGAATLNGQTVDFSDGLGYIEMDSGVSFPKRYTWVQCNDFDEPCSIVASVAHIPFFGFSFQGCICVVWHEGKEYRLATYKGVRVVKNEPGRIELTQGRYRLLITISETQGHPLAAPNEGAMSRTIHESTSCKARFQFFQGNQCVFDRESAHASYEFV